MIDFLEYFAWLGNCDATNIPVHPS